ncbi:MAG: hypothetical protein WCK51_08400 [Armatimonadota bacterium]
MSNNRARKAVIAAFIAVPIVCCAGGVFLVSRKVDYFQESARLDEMMALAKADRLPMTREEVEPEVVPDELNAQFVYQDLIQSWPKLAPKGEVDRQFRDLATNTKRYPEFDPIIEKLEKRPLLKLNKDWDIGHYVLFPELEQAKRLARVMALQAVAEARKGNVSFVKKRLRTLYTMSDTHRTRSHMIPYLCGIAIRAIADSVALHSVVASNGDPQMVEEMRAVLAEPRSKVDLLKPLGGDYYFGLALMRNIKSSRGAGTTEEEEQMPAWTKNPRRSGNPTNTIMKGSLAAFTRHMIEYRRIIRTNYDAKNLGQKLNAYEESIPSTAANLMTSIILPVYGQGIDANRKSDIRPQIAREAINLYRWCKANGRVPKAAAEAGISYTDPYSGKSLGIAMRTDKLYLYSVGVNGKDEGGPRSTGRDSDDFGFWFEFEPK